MATPLKEIFDPGAAQRWGQWLHAAAARHDRSFDQEAFLTQATQNLENLEMRDRAQQFAKAMRDQLPNEIPVALHLLEDALGPVFEGTDNVSEGFVLWPMSEFISAYALEYFDEAMVAMIALTKRFSSEFAVRPFVRDHPERTFAFLSGLTEDLNPHVRRWCSEGTRPRLPWGERLHALCDDPEPIFPLLEALKDDPELYVRRSVANNLNDIAKDHPERVIQICTEWLGGPFLEAPPERAWIVSHALRTLIKHGHPAALRLLGFEPCDDLEVELEIHPPNIVIGEHVQLSLWVHNPTDSGQRLLIDFLVHYRKKRGDARPKVFKWREVSLKPGERVQLSKKLNMKHVSVRALYPGAHRVDIQVNGTVRTHASFLLTERA